MDPLAHALTHPRAVGAFTLLMSMRPPWAVRVADEAALTVMIVTSGRCRIESASGAHDLPEGGVALVRGPHPYRVCDAPDSPTLAVVEPDQRCTSPTGEPLHLAYAHGLRHWGNDPAGPDSVIVASYTDIGSVGRLVTDVLPPVAVLDPGSLDPQLVDHVAHELGADGLGQGVVLDRLVDVLTIESIREWLEVNPPAEPNWVAGIADPVVGVVLRAVHAGPEHPWTVAGLAREAAVSRATLAARFTRLVGIPPLQYLRNWRLAVARDLLAEPGLTLDAIAARVGYSTGFALSAAFTRTYGHSPTAHRRSLAAWAA